MEIEVRPETGADYVQIDQVIRQAFGQEDESRIVNRLRQTAGFVPELALVAVVENRVVGHLLLSRIGIETGQETVPTLALAPIAVAPDWQRKGIGGRLIQEGLKRAEALGFESVIVLGHADYYPKFGFRPAIDWNIKPPFDVPSEVFMALELREKALSQAQGTVRYPSEFFE